MRTLEESIKVFWNRMDKSGDCWIWKGAKSPKGYGEVKFMGERWRANRLAYTLNHGEISHAKMVCHRCDNPSCCNPAHLWLGTAKDNLDDMATKGRARRASPGQNHPNARLNNGQVAAIKETYRVGGISITKIAKAYGVSRGHISLIISGKRWGNVR